jgi:CheY-like chemotaxis protein
MARVTVVNDSEEFLALMAEILGDLGHQMTGYRAIEVSIDCVVGSAPDLLIVDLRLDDKAQELSGWEVMLLARAHPTLRGVPIILCTADIYGIAERETELAEIGGVELVTKPFTIDEMAEVIGRLLDQPVRRS